MSGFCSYPVIDLAATGKNILRMREQRGLSVRELQEYFGFEQPQAIYKWQWGQSLPSVDNLLALSKLFNTKIEDILVTASADAVVAFLGINHGLNDLCRLRVYS